MPTIKAVPEQLFSLKSKLSSAKIKCDEAYNNIQKVIAGLDWEVASKSSINDRLTAVQKRLRKQSDLMQQYLDFLDTAGGRFEATDKELRDKSKDVLYQLGQVGVGLSMANTNPKVDFESGTQISGVDDVAILFGGATPAVSLAAGTSAAALTQTKQTLAITPAAAAASAAVGASGTTTTTTSTSVGAVVGAAVGATNATTTTTQSTGEIVVTFDPYGGTTPTASQKVKKLVPIYGTLPTPKCNDLKFLGWYTAKTGGVKVISGLMVTNLANHTLYARWEVKVTFNSDNGTKDFITYITKGTVYAGPIKMAGEPKKTGYKFDGWYQGMTKITATTVCNDTKNITLKAQWSKSVTGVKIEKIDKIGKGREKTLKAVITPSDATNKKVTWKSKNPGIVSVDEKSGKIKGISFGKTEITVTTDDGKKTASLEITVPEGWRWPIADNKGNYGGCFVGCKCTIHKGSHNGADISAGSGLSVVAIRDGDITKIVKCGINDSCKNSKCTTCYGLGSSVTIEHKTTEGTITSTYGHLGYGSTDGIKKGPILKGKTIGKVGSTGHSTGPHLHLTMKKGTSVLNPDDYLAM